MATLKAGTILFNSENKIALVYRKEDNGYSFPKGHLEKGENLKELWKNIKNEIKKQ